MKMIIRIIAFLCIAGIVAVGGGYFWLTSIYATDNSKIAEATNVFIPPGTGSYQIALKLHEEGAISHPEAFRLLAELKSTPQRFQAGEYRLTPGITPLGIMHKLVTGDVVDYSITIREGLTSAQIRALIEADEALSGDITLTIPEGRLLPETYHYIRGEKRDAIIQRMVKANETALAELWPTRQQDLPFSTPMEALTLASIVEKETGLPSERRRIAAAYINRLRIDMPLQADPTVAYGHYGGQSADKPLTYADLKKDNPYNTYTRKGLPPGPICHPGKEAIAAVLNPLSTKEIFFVATGDGGHRFAENHAQHLRNVAQYRKWQRAQRKKK